jgi:hypothetical protein
MGNDMDRGKVKVSNDRGICRAVPCWKKAERVEALTRMYQTPKDREFMKELNSIFGIEFICGSVRMP